MADEKPEEPGLGFRVLAAVTVAAVASLLLTMIYKLAGAGNDAWFYGVNIFFVLGTFLVVRAIGPTTKFWHALLTLVLMYPAISLVATRVQIFMVTHMPETARAPERLLGAADQLMADPYYEFKQANARTYHDTRARYVAEHEQALKDIAKLEQLGVISYTKAGLDRRSWNDFDKRRTDELLKSTGWPSVEVADRESKEILDRPKSSSPGPSQPGKFTWPSFSFDARSWAPPAKIHGAWFLALLAVVTVGVIIIDMVSNKGKKAHWAGILACFIALFWLYVPPQ